MRVRAHLKKSLVGLCVMLLAFTAMTVAAPLASAAPISQIAPFANAAIDAAGSTFSDQLVTTGQNVDGTESFSVTGTLPAGVTVSSSGQVSSDGSTPVGPYDLAGGDTDTFGDSGTWAYALTVDPSTITQTTASKTGSTTVALSSSNIGQLAVTGNNGAVSYHATGGADEGSFSVTLGGRITTIGPLASGGYVVTGTDVDADLDTGTWTYTLTVTASGGGGSTITQTSLTSGTTTVSASGTFNPGAITVANNTGPVKFATTVSSSGLSVTGGGVVTTKGTLTPGAYTVSGTDSDADGDTGTWTFTLTVTGVINTVSFNAHGGTGTMATESHDVRGALTINSFTRTGYTFVDWNTAADGSGTSYANGATYSFSTSITLYAQWKAGRVPTHSVAFKANGGAGSMAVERDNTPTVLSANHFTRVGHTFTSWNTKANGSGANYGDGATYSFKASVTLYAQWKKVVVKVPVFAVTFNAHDGKGSVITQHHGKPETLSRNSFTRPGYTFVDWNTKANGSGVSYANGAVYSFAASTTLYAQWKKNKKSTPPPKKYPGPEIGPFAFGVSTLSPALESQIQNLVNDVETKSDTQIVLVGYGNKLTAVQELNKAISAKNIELGRERAQAVATYLQGRLTALGLKGWTISIAAAGAGKSGSSQSEIAIVVATLS
jgi:uncharacterized repeat protein (TIGR02543 family)